MVSTRPLRVLVRGASLYCGEYSYITITNSNTIVCHGMRIVH